MSTDDPATRRVERAIGVAFLVAAIAGVALLGLYLNGGQTQLEAVLLAICLGGIGIGITAWSHWLLSGTEHVEPRHSLESPADTAAGFDDETASITRRTFLIRSLVAAFAGLGAALAIPALSLGPAPGRTLFETAWKAGSRVVGIDGLPVNIDTLPVDGVLTVFPEGAVGLGGCPDPPDPRRGWAAPAAARPHGLGAAGLRRLLEAVYARRLPGRALPRRRAQLICPCHQSTFDVLDGATPTFGPAARPLPSCRSSWPRTARSSRWATSRSPSGRASGT